MKIALYLSQREIHTVAAVSSEELSTEIDILIQSPIQVLTKADVG